MTPGVYSSLPHRPTKPHIFFSLRLLQVYFEFVAFLLSSSSFYVLFLGLKNVCSFFPDAAAAAAASVILAFLGDWFKMIQHYDNRQTPRSVTNQCVGCPSVAASSVYVLGRHSARCVPQGRPTECPANASEECLYYIHTVMLNVLCFFYGLCIELIVITVLSASLRKELATSSE